MNQYNIFYDTPLWSASSEINEIDEQILRCFEKEKSPNLSEALNQRGKLNALHDRKHNLIKHLNRL